MALVTSPKIVSAATAAPTTGAVHEVKEHSNHTIQCVYTFATAAPTALEVELQGSLDGVNFSTLGTLTFNGAELSAQFAMLHVTGAPVRFIRGYVKTLTTAGTASIDIFYENGKA